MSAYATTAVEGTDHDHDHQRVPVAGGVLVYAVETEHRRHLGRDVRVGRELVGVENVDDWDALADALAARGHGRGAVFHLPELDQ